MKHLKALGLVVLSSMIALFIGVGSASAVELVPDFNSTWTGVDITDCPSANDPNNPGPPPNVNDACEFTATTDSLPLTPNATFSDGGSPVVANCQVVLTILIWEDGSTKIREVEVNDALFGPTPLVPCSTITTTVDPDDADTWWENQICEDEGASPHQYWDRVEIAFTTPVGAVAGEVFALLDRDAGTGEVSGAQVAGQVDATGSYLEGDFLFDPDPAFVVHSNEDSCDWPEVQ